MSAPLGDVERARAQSNAYHVLAELLARGIDRERLALLDQAPELRDLLLGPGDSARDLEELAAAHTALELETFPLGSVFLSHDAHAGGTAADRVSALYERLDFTSPWSDLAPDALATELAALAAATVPTTASTDVAREERRTALRAELLGDHLLAWLPPWLVAAERLPASPYTRAARLIWELVTDHAATLGVSQRSGDQPAVSPVASNDDRTGGHDDHQPGSRANPQVANTDARREDDDAAPGTDLDLAAPDTGLREIALHLTAPARSGWFLSKRTVAELARASHLPRGFGSRAQELTNALSSAAHFDCFDAFVAGLLEHASWWHRAYVASQSDTCTSPWIEPWLSRLQGTEACLRELRHRAR